MRDNNKRILIIEDDKLLNKTLSFNLVLDGYEVDSTYSFTETLTKLDEKIYDLILLDVNLPDGNGFDLCCEIKNICKETYIIFLTVNNKESDMIRGYEVGGADYVTKPFSLAVLGKKIAVVFQNIEEKTNNSIIYDDGWLKINFSNNTVKIKDETIELTPKEYYTLSLLYTNKKRIVTKGQFMEKLWDVDDIYRDEHTLATIISRIRKKIEKDGRKYIKTSYGIGYQWIDGEVKNEE